jgi:hypothetical protein
VSDIYSIDTSSLMDWQLRYYPSDVFSGIAPRVDALMAAGRLFCAALVQEELEAVGTPGLVQWAGDHQEIFVLPGRDVQPRRPPIWERQSGRPRSARSACAIVPSPSR